MQFTLEGAADGSFNMAQDGELLERAERGEAVGRLYSWDRIWVTLGRFQTPERALVGRFSDYTVRPTGGRAVLHGHDLTVSLALPLPQLGVGPKQTNRAYRLIMAPIIEAISASGALLQLVEDSHQTAIRPNSQDCFALAGPTDLVDATNAKVCGCALRLTDHAILAQCSIPVGPALVEPDSIIVGGVRSAWLPLEANSFFECLASAVNRTF